MTDADHRPRPSAEDTASMIEDSVIYGHLWATPGSRSLFTDRGRLVAWTAILRELALAQADVGLLPEEAARAIAGLDPQAIDIDAVAEGTRATGHSTAGLIDVLRRMLPPHAAEWIYYGATVQDVTDTWMALTMREVTNLLLRDVGRLHRVVLDLARSHRDTPMCGRTHAQPGLPITFGFKVAVWAAELDRHLQRLQEGRPRWELVQLGGALGTMEFWGDKAEALLQRFAGRLGLGVPQTPWLTARDGVAEFMGLLALLASTLAKVGNEVLELQRQEIAEVREPTRAGLVGSITMPHKRNPEVAEHLDTLARLVRADAAVALEGVVHLHERDGRSWKAEWATFPRACTATAAAVTFTTTLLEGLEVDEDRMAHNLRAQGGYPMSGPVMRRLADHVGKHVAQEVVQKAAMRGVRRGTDLRQALLEDAEVARYLSPAVLDACLDPAATLVTATAMVDRVTGGHRR